MTLDVPVFLQSLALFHVMHGLIHSAARRCGHYAAWLLFSRRHAQRRAQVRAWNIEATPRARLYLGLSAISTPACHPHRAIKANGLPASRAGIVRFCPPASHQECLNKAKAILQAFQIAKGFVGQDRRGGSASNIIRRFRETHNTDQQSSLSLFAGVGRNSRSIAGPGGLKRIGNMVYE